MQDEFALDEEGGEEEVEDEDEKEVEEEDEEEL